MSLGTKIKLIVPPDWGYGSVGFSDRIPPNATLTFEMELKEIKDKESKFVPPSI